MPSPPTLLLLAAVALWPTAASAQSGSKRGRPVAPRPAPTAAAAAPVTPAPAPRLTLPAPIPVGRSFAVARPTLALDGLDAVVLHSAGERIPGDPQHVAVFDRRIHRFANADQQRTFEQDPTAYAPVLGGASVVAYAEQGVARPGSTDHFRRYGGRLYLFASAAEQAAFDSEPGRYADADLVMGGLSPVALVERETLLRGALANSVTFDGYRLYFADDAEKERFLARPQRYFPVLGGTDPVSLVEGRPQPGLARFAVVYKERPYLFADAAARDRFVADPQSYSDVDVALEGIDPVQRSHAAAAPGHYAISALYLGKRYLFVSEANRATFLSDPDRYLEQVAQ